MRIILSILKPMATGLFAVLPVVVTFLIIGVIASYIASYLGPGSAFGHRLSDLGGSVVVNERFAYIAGIGLVLAGLYVIGLVVETRLRRLWTSFFNETIGRLPLVGTIYKTISRFVQLLDKKDDVDVKSMSPVWCFFSAENKTAVLGLLATNQTVDLEGTKYHVVLVPTAPVPFGGGLFFLPAEWVKPASFGVEGLTNIYVSMGVTAPDYMNALRDAKTSPPRMITKTAPESPDEQP